MYRNISHPQGVWHVLASTAWRDEEKPLATALHAKLQQQALQLVAKAYANIHVEQAAVIVGMTPQQLLASMCLCVCTCV